MNPRSERSMTVNVALAENEAIVADAETDKLTLAGLCVNGPLECTGRMFPAPGQEPNFRRNGRDFRAMGVFAGGATLAVRKYRCRFCDQLHVFSVEVPRSPAPQPAAFGPLSLTAVPPAPAPDPDAVELGAEPHRTDDDTDELGTPGE